MYDVSSLPSPDGPETKPGMLGTALRERPPVALECSGYIRVSEDGALRNELLTWGPRVRRWILLGMVAGVPILFLRTGVDPFNVPKLAFLLVGVVTVAAVRAAELVQGATFRAARVVLMPGGALVLALVVAWAFSPYRGWAMLGQFGRFQGLLPYILVVVLSLLVYDAFVDDGQIGRAHV